MNSKPSFETSVTNSEAEEDIDALVFLVGEPGQKSTRSVTVGTEYKRESDAPWLTWRANPNGVKYQVGIVRLPIGAEQYRHQS